MREELVKGKIKNILARFQLKQWMPSANKYGMAGVADHIVCWQGRFVSVEAKGTGGRLSQAQKDFGEDILENGGIWLVIDHKNYGELALMLFARGLRYRRKYYLRGTPRAQRNSPVPETNNSWNRHAPLEPYNEPNKARNHV